MLLRSLAEIAGRIGSVRLLALIGLDGLVVERFCLDQDLDVEAIGAQVVASGRAILKDFENLGLGPLRQMSLEGTLSPHGQAGGEGRGDFLMLGMISSDYALLLLADGRNGLSRARYELRRAPLVFADDLP